MQKTRLSDKGQITIPQAIRKAYKWHSGIEFAFIETDQGILLSPVKPFKTTTIQDVLGCTGYKGHKKSLVGLQTGFAKSGSSPD